MRDADAGVARDAAPGSRKHWIVSPDGLKQPPTSLVPTGTSLVVPPVNVVPSGKLTLIRLLRALESTPVAEVVNSTT